jgi:hypothetical protein
VPTFEAKELSNLYETRRLSLSATAAILGCSPTTVRRRLKDWGFRPRSRGRQPRLESTVSWTPELAYVVGLIATDGNLSRDGRHLTLASSDRELLDTAKRCLNLRNRLGRSPTPGGGVVYRLQWSDRTFHMWLQSIGLAPAKSLTRGPLDIPTNQFQHFLRGCIDGDGSIVTYVDRHHASRNPAYVYTRLFVSLVSASPGFLGWVRAMVRKLRSLTGHVTVRRALGRHDLWRLRYAKAESIALLRWLYPSQPLPCLARKRERARAFLTPSTRPPRLGPGRPMVV